MYYMSAYLGQYGYRQVLGGNIYLQIIDNDNSLNNSEEEGITAETSGWSNAE